MDGKESFYVSIVVHFYVGDEVKFETVRRKSVEIDDDNYLRFERLLSLDKWANVVIDMDENVRYYEVIPED